MEFRSPEHMDGGRFTEVLISWDDINTLLNMPSSQTRFRSPDLAKNLVRNYLSADKFESEASKLDVDDKNIFINFLPLAKNAGITLFPHIKDHVHSKSGEAKSFLNMFQYHEKVSLSETKSGVVEFSLPED